MRELIAFISSWASVTTVFFITTANGGLESAVYSALEIWGLFGVFSGIYYLVIGIPIFYFISKFKRIARSTFIYTGLAASVPILSFSIVTKEPVWVTASILGGFVGGLVFALLLPFKKYT